MSTPEDPFAKPTGQPSAGSAPIGSDGPPSYGSPPGYGAPPSYGNPPAYGAPPAYGNPPGGYGTPPAGYGSPSGFGAGSGRPELASWGTRVGGTLIDGLASAAFYVVGAILGGIVGGGFGALLAVLGFLGGLAFLIYNLIQQGNTGQTIGKKQMGTRLLREQDGQVVGPGLSIGRQFVHVVDSFFYIGYLWPLWDAKKQTFADKILKTVVVKG